MGGFFGPTQEFDDFLERYMTPAMEAGGFTRAKRVYRLHSDGAHVVVQARLYSPLPVVYFHIEWVAIPAVLRDYLKEMRPGWRPSMSRNALVQARLLGANRLCNGGEGRSGDDDFRYADPAISVPAEYSGLIAENVDIEQFGPRYLDFLQTSAVPKWRRALTVEFLQTVNETDNDVVWAGRAGIFNSARYGKPAAVRAILGVDSLPREEAKSAIDEFQPADDPIVPWLRRRLASRS